MQDIMLLFVGQFANVLLLVLNSRLLRDDKVIPAVLISWLITAAQLSFVYIIKITNLDIEWLYLASALGGSCGVACAHYFYVWVNKPKIKEEK